jgi:TATA element modulatory factor 1 TATA binding
VLHSESDLWRHLGDIHSTDKPHAAKKRQHSPDKGQDNKFKSSNAARRKRPLTAQRDEARQEVVSLMREVEMKRANDKRTNALEEEQRAINERYQTTLELLGEKSELVEELKADVADVKQMYRDLVESTMK